LVKTYCWGLHFDEHVHVAAYEVETDDYQRLSASARLKQMRGFRRKRDRF
jgi:hypothetical protein